MVKVKSERVRALISVAGALMMLTACTVAAPTGRVRLSTASLPWDAEARTLQAALDAIERAACDGADLVALPQECVPTEGEPIPGPIFNELAHEAFRWGIYVAGCLRERDADKTYLTGFLIDPRGELVGKYRKSHRLPREKIALGDDLPVFETEFGTIGITIGTDHLFPEIDRVLGAKGAGTIIWCTAPWPWRNEYPIDIVLRGRARDFYLNYVVSRYYGIKAYGGYDKSYSGYTARWPIGRAYVIRRRGLVVASTGYNGGGVATATLDMRDVAGRGRAPSGYLKKGLYHEIGGPTPPPNESEYAKRRIKVAVVESEQNFDRLLEKLDLAGQLGADIVGNWEYVWSTKLEAEECQRRLAAIGEVAARHQMYILFGGYLNRPHYNDGLLWDRSGKIIGRFTKIHVTTFGKKVGQIGGTECPVFETDFGRIGVKICADEGSPEIDRVYGLKRADLIFHPTQSAGPYAAARELRDKRRAIDNGCWFVSINNPSAEADHRSFIIDPWGYIVAASNFAEASVFVHEIDLDRRPAYYVWPAGTCLDPGAPDPWKQKQSPKKAGDLREVIMQQRRPQLYQLIGSAPKAD